MAQCRSSTISKAAAALGAQLVGPEPELIELYPGESRKVATANQYFLWCVLNPSFRFPWGCDQRLVTSEQQRRVNAAAVRGRAGVNHEMTQA